jgi:hypothetical protein
MASRDLTSTRIYTMEEEKIKRVMINFLMEKIGSGFSDKVLEYASIQETTAPWTNRTAMGK